ncbi:hypothetical protein ACLKA6_010077 [Drosophila palustris]
MGDRSLFPQGVLQDPGYCEGALAPYQVRPPGFLGHILRLGYPHYSTNRLDGGGGGGVDGADVSGGGGADFGGAGVGDDGGTARSARGDGVWRGDIGTTWWMTGSSRTASGSFGYSVSSSSSSSSSMTMVGQLQEPGDHVVRNQIKQLKEEQKKTKQIIKKMQKKMDEQQFFIADMWRRMEQHPGLQQQHPALLQQRPAAPSAAAPVIFFLV